jgi:hypothetical protein
VNIKQFFLVLTTATSPAGANQGLEDKTLSKRQ